jgi:glutamate carboxypeptidase
MPFSLQAYLDELHQLVNIDSGTMNTAGLDVVAALISEKYLNLGWQIKHIDLGEAGYGIQARNKPESDNIDVLLIGHMDTVFPQGTIAARPFSTDEKRAYGPGAADMKSGLLNIVYALRSLDQDVLDKLAICVCMNPDEETGSTYSGEWLRDVATQSRTVLVAEAARADGSLIKARKGMARYEITFSGVAAHAGNEPEKGRSAILEMAGWVQFIDQMNNLDAGTTLNTGIVQGGSGANVVADSASAIVDVRFWHNDEYTQVNERLLEKTSTPFIDGVTVELNRIAHKPAMVPGDDTAALMAVVEQAGRETGVNITWQSVGGGSDANATAALGIPTLDGFGPVGGNFHRDDEYLELNSIEPRIGLLQAVLTKLAG